jgi:hypothetical protein
MAKWRSANGGAKESQRLSEPVRVKTPKGRPRFAIRMEYRGGERITPLPLTQDMIRQLALEAGFRALNVGELVGEVVRATITNNLVHRCSIPEPSGATQFGNQRPHSEERKSRAGKA